MRPGDKLPSEAELMERYGHSRGRSGSVLDLSPRPAEDTYGPSGVAVHEVSEARTRALPATIFIFRIYNPGHLPARAAPDLVYSLAGKLSDDVLDELKCADQWRSHPVMRKTVVTMRLHSPFTPSLPNSPITSFGFHNRFMAEILSEITTGRR